MTIKRDNSFSSHSSPTPSVRWDNTTQTYSRSSSRTVRPYREILLGFEPPSFLRTCDGPNHKILRLGFRRGGCRLRYLVIKTMYTCTQCVYFTKKWLHLNPSLPNLFRDQKNTLPKSFGNYTVNKSLVVLSLSHTSPKDCMVYKVSTIVLCDLLCSLGVL